MKTAALERASAALLATQRHSWEQGVAMQAYLEAGQYDLVCAMAFEAVNRSLADGRAAVIGVTDGVTDHCAVGEGLKVACEMTADPVLRRGRSKLLEWALYGAPRNSRGIIYHLNRTEEFWADSFYMLPPYLAAEGQWDEAVRQWDGYWDALYDPKTGLLCHKWDDAKQEYSGKEHWGIGIGWALASVPRMLRHLPQEDAGWGESLKARALALLETLLGYLRPDGCFHEVVDEPDTFVEVNLSQMTAYFIYQGIAGGWLAERFRAYADRMRAAANARMNAFGFISEVCGAPTFDRPGYAPEAQAFYLLMETAAEASAR